jgi:hypothetical protein
MYSPPVGADTSTEGIAMVNRLAWGNLVVIVAVAAIYSPDLRPSLLWLAVAALAVWLPLRLFSGGRLAILQREDIPGEGWTPDNFR